MTFTTSCVHIITITHYYYYHQPIIAIIAVMTMGHVKGNHSNDQQNMRKEMGCRHHPYFGLHCSTATSSSLPSTSMHWSNNKGVIVVAAGWVAGGMVTYDDE